jgi:hypothetical protein
MLNILSEWQKPLLHVQKIPSSWPDTIHRLTTMTDISLCYPVLSTNNKYPSRSWLLSYTILHSTVHLTFYPLSELTASWNNQEPGWELKWYPQKHTSKVKCLISSFFTYLLTHSMEHSASWEANWFSASQEIPRILWNPKVHYHIHKCLPPIPILSG